MKKNDQTKRGKGRRLWLYPGITFLAFISLYLIFERMQPTPVETGIEPIRSANNREIPPTRETRSADQIHATSRYDFLVARMTSGSIAQRQAAWRALRGALLASPDEEATEFIEAFLASGVSVPTGLDFIVDRFGNLATAPDLRTLMLDILETIDPTRAQDKARRTLSAPSHPDDWAIALRIISRSTGPDDTWLQDRVWTLLSREDWLESPTPSLLQGFDAAVYVQSEKTTRRLIELTDDSRPGATRYAARLALNRKAETDFASVGALIAESFILADDPGARAALIARADIRIGADRRILESYLAGLDPAGPEALAFVARFPNYNQVVSNNLITTVQLTPIADRMAQDRATMTWVTERRSDPAFTRIKPILDRIESRLVGYLVETSPPPPVDEI